MLTALTTTLFKLTVNKYKVHYYPYIRLWNIKTNGAKIFRVGEFLGRPLVSVELSIIYIYIYIYNTLLLLYITSMFIFFVFRSFDDITPSDRWAISSAHTRQQWVKPNAQSKQTKNGTQAPCARPAPRVLRGSYPPVRSPPGSPGQWSVSSPGAHDGHPHRGPPSQGRSPPASADDGAATNDALPLKASRPSPC